MLKNEDGLTYKLYPEHVELVAMEVADGVKEVSIPAEIECKPVKVIGGSYSLQVSENEYISGGLFVRTTESTTTTTTTTGQPSGRD